MNNIKMIPPELFILRMNQRPVKRRSLARMEIQIKELKA
jgi:hypothetical protein